MVVFRPLFEKQFKRLKEPIKSKVYKQILKIVESPEIGKPMRFSRKGTREVRVSPYRLSYGYVDGRIIFLDIYRKDAQ